MPLFPPASFTPHPPHKRPFPRTLPQHSYMSYTSSSKSVGGVTRLSSWIARHTTQVLLRIAHTYAASTKWPNSLKQIEGNRSFIEWLSRRYSAVCRSSQLKMISQADLPNCKAYEYRLVEEDLGVKNAKNTSVDDSNACMRGLATDKHTLDNLPSATKTSIRQMGGLQTNSNAGTEQGEPPVDSHTQSSQSGQLYVHRPLLKFRDIWILFLHGGSFCLNNPNVYEVFMSDFTKRANVNIFAPAYSRTPEYTWPRGLNDAIDAYKHLLFEKKIPPEKIFFMGDSAGGNLAVSSVIKLATHAHTHTKVTGESSGESAKGGALPLPAGILSVSPWLDLSLSGPSYQKNLKSDGFFPFDSIKRAAWIYMKGSFDFFKYSECVQDKLKEFCISKGMPYIYGTEEDRYFKKLRNPLISPVYLRDEGVAQLFPPTFIQVSDSELLLSDSLIFGRKLNKLAVHGGNDGFSEEAAMFEKFGQLDEETSAALRTNGCTYIPTCHPHDAGPAQVKVWSNEFHAFPMFGLQCSRSGGQAVDDMISWMKDRM